MRGLPSRVRFIVLLALVGTLPVLSIGIARAAVPSVPQLQSIDSGPDTHHDVSPPLRTLKGAPPPANTRPVEAHAEAMPQRRTGSGIDPLAPLQGRSATRLAPTPSHNYDGVGNGVAGFTVNSAPPDTNSAVGPTQVVEIVNSGFAVFSKSTNAVLYGAVNTNTLFSGFGGLCESDNDGDGVVRYDNAAGRWIISQFAVTGATTSYLQCIAVSTTGDATGSYYRYSFSYANFPDYPKMGVWPDAYYFTYNMFQGGSVFVGAEACAMNRSAMLTGAAATQQCFTTSSSFGGVLPSDLDGSTAPPTGEPNLMLALGTTSTTLDYWKFHVDWTTPSNSTFTGPTDLTVAAYSQACGGGTCIPQPNTTQQLDSLADRLMFRLAYQNFGNHESLVVSHSVDVGGVAAVRWYEFRLSSGNPTVYQQGTYNPDSTFRWMPSIAMDKSGDIAVGFSTSSSSVRPGVHFTARLSTDTLGTMTQGEGDFIDGGGSQTGNLSRWGDYSSMSIDPSDGCTFWYSNEYIPSDGSFNWKTRIGAFSLSGCGSTTNDFSISDSPASGTVTQGGSTTSTISTATTSGSAQTVSLSASGLPSGASVSFSPTSVTSGGSSTMTITTASTTPTGTYSITVSGTGSSATHTTTFSLTVNATSGSGITNGGFETGTFSGWTTTGTTSITTSSPHSGTYSGQAGASTPTNGDSTIVQTFTAPTGASSLQFWYQMSCPDTVTYDWATATLKDNTSNTTTTPLGKICTTNSWTKVSTSITAGHSYTLTLVSHDDNYSADPSFTKFDDVATTSPPANPIVNPGFETGNTSGWTTAGTTSVTTSSPHSGTYAGLAGSTSPTNGDSSFAQTFTAPTGSSTLSFWYSMTCPDTVTYDWATATLKDNTSNTTSTVLAKTCNNNGWTQVTASVTAGHSYTITLISHDDNYPSDPSYTKFDDVVVS
ncbi:MAG: hypothetical protein ACYDCC_10785 [Actinomycetota bacterium]